MILANEVEPGESCSGCVIVPGFFAAAAAVPGGAIGYAIGAPGGDWRETKGHGLTVAGGGPTRGARVSLRLRVP